MGCFLGCFGNKKDKKDRKRRKPANKVLPREQRHVCYKPLESAVSPQQEEIVAKPLTPIPEPSDKIEEKASFSGTRKRVTFDLNVKAYEEVVTQEIAQSEEDEEEEGKNEDKISRSTSLSEDESSLVSYPSNHRYGNCSNSDDEFEGIESEEESDLDGEEDDDDDYEDVDLDEEENRRLGDGESSESFFSLPADSRTQGFATPVAEKEVNSPLKTSRSLDEEAKPLQPIGNARDRSQYVHSVLNPVENLTQWKALKAKPPLSPSPLKNQKKENISLEQEPQLPFSPEPTFKLSSFSSFNSGSIQSASPPSKQEMAVDTSLSNWLGSSDTTPSIKSINKSVGIGSVEVNKSPKSPTSYSPRSQEDRPILGALTLEEIKQFSATSSPRRSPTHSPDDKPILGTVGSYWRHTDQTTDSSSSSSFKGIPNTTSKYREDKRVNWHSTPFETRLERALNRGAAEGYTSF